jgi:hypothetical protein
MKRRGLFGFLAAAPIGAVAGTAAAVQKSEPESKPLFKECNIHMMSGVTFKHGTPLPGWKQPVNVIAFQVPPQTDIKDHGSLIMYEGELFIRPEHGEWRKIS